MNQRWYLIYNVNLNYADFCIAINGKPFKYLDSLKDKSLI